LLPDRLDGRSVIEGQLGCPVCGRTFRLADGVLDTGDAPSLGSTSPSRLTAAALTPLIGLNGPGGYLVLVGSLANDWEEVAELNPGVALVGINPEAGIREHAPGFSVLRSGRIPLKTRSMRGVALGPGYARDQHWVSEAARVVLPGLRIVGEGAEPPAEIIDLMASAGGIWVGTTGKTVSGPDRGR
jgi:hypothetical protein